MGTSLYDDLFREPAGGGKGGGLYDDLFSPAPPKKRDVLLSKVPAPFRRMTDDAMVMGADVAATVPRIVSGLAGLEASLLESPLKRRRQNEVTRLTPDEEQKFQAWVQANGIADVDDPQSFYDYRGAYKAGVGSEVSAVDGAPHWPDTFKQHGHPTFSRESQYSKGEGDGGTWGGADGEQFTPGKVGMLERLTGLLRGVQGKAIGAANQIEEWGAPRDGWQAIPKLAAGVGKYIAMGPAAGVGAGAAEAYADPNTSQTALVAELDQLNNPVAQAVGGVARRAAETPMGRVAGDLLINEGVGRALQGLRGMFARPAPIMHAPVTAPVESPRALPPGQYEMPGETPMRWPEGMRPQPVPAPRVLGPGQYDLPAQAPSSVAQQQQSALDELFASLDAQPKLLPATTSGPRPMPAKSPSTVAAERAAREAALESDPVRQAMLSRAEKSIPQQRLQTSTGSETWGEIGDDVASATGIRPAPIWMRRDAAEHLWESHQPELERAGYASAEQFVEQITKGYDQIRVNKEGLTLVRDGRPAPVAYIKWTTREEADAWEVASGAIIDSRKLKKQERVWPTDHNVGSRAEVSPDLPSRSGPPAEASPAVPDGKQSIIDPHAPPEVSPPPNPTRKPDDPEFRYSGGPAEVGGAVAGAATADDDADDTEVMQRALMGAAGVAGARALYKRRAGVPAIPTPTRVPDVPTPKASGYTGPVDVDDFANVAKFGLDASGEQRLRATVEKVVRERGHAPKGTQSWSEVEANAKALGLDADALLKKGDAKRLDGSEMLAIRTIIADNVRALDTAAKEMATNPSAERAATLDLAMSNLERQNDALLSRFVTARTQAGRDLNNLKIVAQQTLDPAYWLAKAARQLGVDALPADVHAELAKRLAAGDRAGVATMVAGLRTHTTAQKITQLWKVGLLTNPRTHIANAVSNTVMGAAELAKDVPAYLADRLLMAATGQQSKAAPTAGIVAASWKGARAGIEDAKKILRGELVPDALGKFDLSKGEVDFGNRFLNAYGNWVFRALSASDKVFSGSALKRSLTEQATVIAQREGLKGDAMAKRIADLVERPLEPMALQAITDAQVATFQNPNAISESIAKLKSGLKKIPRVGEYVGEGVLPFSKTPGAVASSFVRYSPIGLADGFLQAVDVWASARKGVTNLSSQRKAVEDIGRGAVGTTLLWMGYELAKDGKMNGAFPAGAEDRSRWQLSNRQENSVLVDGKWRSVEKLGPAGVLMATGANLAEMMRDPENASLVDVATATGSSMLKTVGEQSSLTGLESVAQAIGDPKRAAKKYVQQQAASVVPAAIGGASRALDPTMRETETAGDAVKARVPGAGRDLPAKLDVLGEERRGEGGAVANLADPMYSRSDRRQSDALVRELDRVGLGITPLKKQPGEDATRYRDRVKAVGQAMREELRAAIETPGYTEDLRGEAKRLKASGEPEYSGRSVEQITADLQRDFLKDVITRVRRLMAKGASDE